ncbi:unnamed protein product [Cuscuta europaea]|uniref:GH16 domain-containing protein n=1 Tax=Cuscuta europaea TaxID=41803 RepID=A0A9P0YZE8_CUSEU|nr:unnamed protein product [Cuscuta europaea]
MKGVSRKVSDYIQLLHTDTLVKEGWDDPYVPQTHEGLLKWKYPEMNSVDPLIEIRDERELLYLNEEKKPKLMEGSRVVFQLMSLPSLGNMHDEMDFKFLRDSCRFSMDNIPIRVFTNNKAMGVPFPNNQSMKVYASLWNADESATQGGLDKIDCSKALFSASYMDFKANACF